MKTREMDEQILVDELRKFLEQLHAAKPSWDDGESHSIKIEGAVAGNDDDNIPVFSFHVTRTQEAGL